VDRILSHLVIVITKNLAVNQLLLLNRVGLSCYLTFDLMLQLNICHILKSLNLLGQFFKLMYFLLLLPHLQVFYFDCLIRLSQQVSCFIVLNTFLV
jgi:hypothetical protein